MQVEIPNVDQDKFNLGRVGIIAAFGFGIGLLWPTLAGVKLVPRPPTDPVAVDTERPAAPAATSAVPAPPPAPAATTGDSGRIKLGGALVTSCVSEDGKKQKECGASPIDAVVKPRLMALAECEGAADAVGLLSLGLEYDVARGQITDFQRGKSTTLADEKADALIGCARQQLGKASFENVRPPLASYTVFYPLEFSKAPAPAAAGSAAGGDDVTLASGVASVSWNVALIRSEPDKDGEIVARVLSGTRVSVTGRRGDWYRVKYDAKGNEGWVFRGAIGL